MLIFRVIKLGALVLEISSVRHHQKAMSIAWWDIKLEVIGARQADADPLFKGPRLRVDVNGNIKHLPLCDMYQFALWFFFLEVNTPEHTLA